MSPYTHWQKTRAYAIDPECWVSYSNKPREFKREMDRRRSASLVTAVKESEKMSAKTQRKSKVKVKKAAVKQSRAYAKYCIIGVDAFNRTWLDTEAAAVKHAEPMFRKNINPDANPVRLMVVKAVRIIEKKPPASPPLIVRAPKDFDFPPNHR